MIFIGSFMSCTDEVQNPDLRFSKLSSSSSGIDFENKLSFRQDFNIYTYRNYYNGGGVGIADINNDGFVDIYFTANMESNKLYLNNGDLTFTDITDIAGVSGSKSWSTGVSMVDINGDNWVDIYVCNSGDIDGDNKQNELFINQGDGTFLEDAKKYGLADKGFSTHAAFFDYDKDNDLDVYLLNNSFQAIGSFNLRKNQRPIRHPEGGDKLFRNDNGEFKDVSEEAGIYGSIIGFGLGVTLGDIDVDGWVDMYISNDFFERDYIYMNNGDGTFTENLEEQMKSISGASMGADMADINNDGYMDIFVTEMLPEPNNRLKTKTTFENWDKYQYNIENGYYHQFTRNMLQLNNGNSTFSEIGRLSGVEATDWSWGALICDFDNDGLRDLFIANGIHKELTDQDYINYISTEEMARKVISKDGVDFKTLTEVIPSNKIPNYMYQNRGNLEFKNVSSSWGLDEPSHSNGSAYADLDNDGDMDLVINNVNEIASVYVNHSIENNQGNYLKIILIGPSGNSNAIGTRIKLVQRDNQYFHEQFPVRGFESSVDPRPHFGLPSAEVIDTIQVNWPDGTQTVLTNISADQIIDITYSSDNAILANKITSNSTALFSDITASTGIDFVHKENDYVDFDRDRLLFHMLSAEGPALCTADFNKDGLEDIYIGGAAGQSGALYLARPNGKFYEKKNTAMQTDAASEDVDCACFDADNDGDIDMYVASGSNEFSSNSSLLIDRLYLNNGKAGFTKSEQILPTYNFQNTSTVEAADIDGDGDQDLFVGARSKPTLIGVPVDGFLLENDGNGQFTNVTKENAPQLTQLGMITDAVWVDYDADQDSDLIVVGEWMKITVFENIDGKLKENINSIGLDSTEGWWNTIHPSDLDNDGDIDFVVGNHGLNSRFQASRKKPVTMYVNDFDRNGSAEAIICQYFGEESYPLLLKHDLTMQLPSLKKKYVKYESFQNEGITDIFTEEELKNAITNQVYQLSSVILINDNGTFTVQELPAEAQLSPVYGIETLDVNGDEYTDIILGGNFYYAKPEVGRYDASYGVLLEGDGNGNFKSIPNRQTGLKIDGQVKDIKEIKLSNKRTLFIAKNDAPINIVKISN